MMRLTCLWGKFFQRTICSAPVLRLSSWKFQRFQSWQYVFFRSIFDKIRHWPVDRPIMPLLRSNQRAIAKKRQQNREGASANLSVLFQNVQSGRSSNEDSSERETGWLSEAHTDSAKQNLIEALLGFHSFRLAFSLFREHIRVESFFAKESALNVYFDTLYSLSNWKNWLKKWMKQKRKPNAFLFFWIHNSKNN